MWWWLLLFSCSVVSDSSRLHARQHVRPPCPSPSPGVCSNSRPLSRWYHWTISFSVTPSPHDLNLSHHQNLFQWVSSLHLVAKVSELQLQHQPFQWISWIDFLQDGLVRSPCSPRDSNESSPTPQFKSFDSSILYGPTLTSIHNYWKTYSFAYMHLCWHSNFMPDTNSTPNEPLLTTPQKLTSCHLLSHTVFWWEFMGEKGV